MQNLVMPCYLDVSVLDAHDDVCDREELGFLSVRIGVLRMARGSMSLQDWKGQQMSVGELRDEE